MTVPVQSQENQAQALEATKQDHNFTHLRQQVAAEKKAREAAEQRTKELEEHVRKSGSRSDDDDADSDEPYVDRRILDKRFKKFEENISKTIDSKAEEKARSMMAQERQATFFRSNPDFQQVMAPEVLQKFGEKYPDVAESLLALPDNFERQKLVYNQVKALGVHKKEEPKQSVQDKIDQNRRSPYYQPSGVANAPYASQGDFSPAGQKNAFEKLQQLKNNLRLG